MKLEDSSGHQACVWAADYYIVIQASVSEVRRTATLSAFNIAIPYVELLLTTL